MEPFEAAQRLRHHLWVVVLFFLAGLAVPLMLHTETERTYVATVRLMIGGSDTNNSDQSKALADTAMGIVTSRGHVEAALADIGAERDPHLVADKAVRIEPIGSSGVLEMSVSDEDPVVAAKIANALTDGLVKLRREVVTGDSARLLDEVTAQIREVNRQIDDISRQVSEAESVVTTRTFGAPMGALQLQHDAALRERSDLEGERQRLIEALAATPEPTVIDAAAPPRGPEPSDLMARLAIGGLLGLVLGLGAATLLESLNPTVVSPEALSRTLGAPILGRLPRRPDRDSALRDPWLPEFLRLAAADAGVEKARLVAVGRNVDLHRLAGWLRADDTPEPEPSPGGSAGHGLPFAEVAMVPPEDRERQSGLFRVRDDRGHATGLVVVAPRVVRRRALTALEQQRAVTRWPLLGVVTYRRGLSLRRRHDVVPHEDVVPQQHGEMAAASAVSVR